MKSCRHCREPGTTQSGYEIVRNRFVFQVPLLFLDGGKLTRHVCILWFCRILAETHLGIHKRKLIGWHRMLLVQKEKIRFNSED